MVRVPQRNGQETGRKKEREAGMHEMCGGIQEVWVWERGRERERVRKDPQPCSHYSDRRISLLLSVFVLFRPSTDGVSSTPLGSAICSVC